MGYGHGPWDMGFTLWHGFGTLFMLLVLVLVGVLVYAVVRGVIRGGSPQSGGDTALAILRERYARGEITAEEFERMKRDLAT